MSADAAEIVRGSKSEGGGKQKLLSLDDLDGRTRAAQVVRQTIDAATSDLGGDAELSTAERMIIRRAAIAGAMAEDLAARWLTGEPVDTGTFASLTNVERRQFEAVGLKRVPRDLNKGLRADILASKGQAA